MTSGLKFLLEIERARNVRTYLDLLATQTEKPKMKFHPFDECLRAAITHMKNGADVYQQFNCATCGAKQTMDVPNKFFTEGICEKCGGHTDIKRDGCNYMLHMVLR